MTVAREGSPGRGALGWAAALAVAACGAGEVSGGPESAVEFTFAELSPEPVVAVGGLDERPGYAFGSVGEMRFVGDEGAFVAIDVQAAEIRHFDAAGVHLGTFGGQGDGLGEFGMISALNPGHADSVHVFDMLQRRVTTLALADGGFRVVRIPQADPRVPFIAVEGLLGDGSVLSRDHSGDPPDEEVEDGVHRFDDRLILHRTESPEETELLAVVDGSEEYYRVVNGDHGSLLTPFGRRSLAAARGERVAFGTTDRIEIVVTDPDGDTLIVIREDIRPRAVSQDEVDSLYESRRRSMSSIAGQAMPEEIRERFLQPIIERTENAPISELVPTFDRLMIDSQGRIWIRLFSEVPFADRRRYLVYGGDGARLGGVAIDRELIIYDAHDDLVLIETTDELDVATVEVRRVLW